MCTSFYMAILVPIPGTSFDKKNEGERRSYSINQPFWNIIKLLHIVFFHNICNQPNITLLFSSRAEQLVNC